MLVEYKCYRQITKKSNLAEDVFSSKQNGNKGRTCEFMTNNAHGQEKVYRTKYLASAHAARSPIKIMAESQLSATNYRQRPAQSAITFAQ